MASIAGAAAGASRSAVKRTSVDPKGFSFQQGIRGEQFRFDATSPTQEQIMLRVKNEDAVKFWEARCGFTHIHKYSFKEMAFDLHFLASLSDEQQEEFAKVKEAGNTEEYLWTFPGTVLELTVNHGDHTYWPGNNKAPEGLDGDALKKAEEQLEADKASNRKDGFGHVAITVDSVEDWCKVAEEEWGLKFQKKPHEGRMKGLAFAKTPGDGYWIEVITRKGPIPGIEGQRPQLNQCMLRVKDPKKSIAFYERLGMTLLAQRHFPKDKGDFSLFFMASLPEGTELPFDASGEEEDWTAARRWMTENRNICVLELTHNHGTEADEAFGGYNTGNEADRKGFGHVGFLVDDLEKDCAALGKEGVAFKKKPEDGKMRGIAFALDPDGYWVELIQRGMKVGAAK